MAPDGNNLRFESYEADKMLTQCLFHSRLEAKFYAPSFRIRPGTKLSGSNMRVST
jgi:hypothetical protein